MNILRFIICCSFVLCAFGCGVSKSEEAKSSATEQATIVSKIIDAESSVEISHRILVEALSELDSAASSDQMAKANASVRRSLDAEALHCQSAYDKAAAIKDGLATSSVDSDTKSELLSILSSFQETYSVRKSALQKASDALKSLGHSSKSSISPDVKEAISRATESQDAAHRTASKLVAFCAKRHIVLEQK